MNESGFGTIDASGTETQIGPGRFLDANLLVAPNGTLYAYEASYLTASHPWGVVNPSTGSIHANRRLEQRIFACLSN